MADVFISYHEASEGELAEQLADTLERAGISCWYMGRDSIDAYAGQITREIRACAVFVLILDKGSNQSKHVQNEVSIAFQEEKRLLPFRMDSCELSDDLRYYLNRFTVIKANLPDERRVERFVKRIAKALNRDTQPPTAKIIKRGECGDNVSFALDENGVLTISGSGAMRDFQRKNQPWQNEGKLISSVEIGNNATAIGGRAFQDCAGLASVVIPDSVKYIGRWAFAGCRKLKSVSVPLEAEIHSQAFPHWVRIERRA